MRGLLWLLLLAVPVGYLIFAPSPSQVAATHGCASVGSPAGAFDLRAYEAEDWRSVYGRTLGLAAFNELLPELSDFALPRVETGSRSAGSASTADPYVPPVVLRAIAWVESGWQMADSSVSYGEVGPPLVSHSCAYGAMQILSGMENNNDVPTVEQVSIGSHYGFNIARGARILATKWNFAPEFRPIVGSRDPSLVEDWYYAIWSYSGFSFTNHPLNPSYSALRGVYRCDGSQSISAFPYQELVLGCVANPPTISGSPLWSPLAVTLPNLSQPAFSLSNWIDCSGSFQCAGMDIPTPTPSHADPAQASGDRSEVIGSPALAANPLGIVLVAVPGSQSGQVQVTIANSGTGPMAWRLSPPIDWLRYSRSNGISLGSDLGSLSSSVTMWADADGLIPGTYTGVVNVASLYPQTTSVINVTLVVGNPVGFVPGIVRD